MSRKQEVVVKEDQLPAEVSELLGANMGMGFEHAEADDYAIPFIYIVQKASKVIDTNPDARPGMLLNTVSGDLYRELILIPCAFKKDWVEWIPQEQGGGLVDRHDYHSGIDKEAVRNEKNVLILPNGNQLVDTRYHYVLCINPETGEMFPAVIAMTSTQVKRSRKWMSLMSGKKVTIGGVEQQAPTFAFQYVGTTEMDSKDEFKWYSWSIRPGERVTHVGTLHAAIEFHKAIMANDVKLSDETLIKE
jgi:hypothetical protein